MSPNLTLRLAGAKVGTIIVFGVVPVALTAYLFAVGGHGFAYDFHQAFWPAGRDVLHGHTPYVDPSSPQVTRNVAFIYPAVAALVLAPFALLSRASADELFTALNIAAVVLTLRVLNVRDWRLYGLVMLCPSVYYGWHLANVTMPIMLGVAAVWRWRDRRVVAGLLVAMLVSVKMFVWPLGLWLLASRRYAAFAWAVGASVVLNVVAWLVIGFDQLGPYRQLLQAATNHQERDGYSPVSIALRLGADRPVAYAVALVLTAVGGVCVVAFGRRRLERTAMTVAVALCLVASPIVWLPYFALLMVPLAVAHPRLSAAWWWLLPMWACSPAAPPGWQVAVALASATALVVTSTATRSLGHARASTQPQGSSTSLAMASAAHRASSPMSPARRTGTARRARR